MSPACEAVDHDLIVLVKARQYDAQTFMDLAKLHLFSIDLARSDAAALGELLGPVGVRGGEHHLGLRLGDIGLGTINRDFKGPWINDEEKVAFFNELAVGKIDLVQRARHARALRLV